MIRSTASTLILVLLATALGGCLSDQTVQIRYLPDQRMERLAGAQPVTVFRFADRRGDEGDRDPLRVGGMYDGYGSRLAKVLTTTPWPETLAQSLVSGFSERGVEAVAVPDREFVPRESAISTPFALAGEIHNFSAETRWTLQAHISGVVRLYDSQGALVSTRTVSARMPRDNPNTPMDPQASAFQNYLNLALQQFVRAVVTDPELSQRLLAPRSAGAR